MQAIIQNQLYLQFRKHFHPLELPVNIKIVLQQLPNLLNLLSMATLMKLAGEILILIPFKYSIIMHNIWKEPKFIKYL